MCGIAGLVNRSGRPVDLERLREMTHVQRHRGPDAEGFFVNGNVGLGHCRLKIIDTSEEANQPLFNEDGSVAVVFNGEIYNFGELTRHLTEQGHIFKTRCDTEVLVHAWEEYGFDCLARLHGMFAFAIYDLSKKQLFLARDRLGKKPLFYAFTTDGFAFGSEIKALLLAPGVGRELDPIAVGEYTTYGNSLGARTIYASVHKLPPGHRMLLDLNSSDLHREPERYWRLSFDVDDKPTEQEWIQQLDQKLSEAVQLRLVSDVPLGAFLSGGIDSSLIVAYMTQHSNKKVQTYTIGFPEASHDESRYAASVAEYLQTDHHSEILTPRALEILPELVEAYDEPFGDLSAVPTYYLCRMTRQHVTVALSGDGGDESFLGYNRYPGARALNTLGQLITPAGRRLAGMFAGLLPDGLPGQRSLARLSLQDFELYDHVMGCSRERLSLLKDDVRSAFQSEDEKKMLADYSFHGQLHLLERYQYTDLMNYLPEDILVKVDRASMYHSLEVRCPLLDQEVVELAAKIPVRAKLTRFSGKTILKRLLGKYLPARLFERPKRGFGVPFSSWFRADWKTVASEMIADTGSPMWDYFDRRSVEKRFKQQSLPALQVAENWWRLLFFHRWCDAKLRGLG
jgi:asparagine synthase (glutamine-hydrolysing)